MRLSAGILAGLCACTVVTADELPAAELGEVCGQTGPFRLLALDPGQVLTRRPWASGGRYVARVGTYTSTTQIGTPSDTTGIALWSTGPCGEAPVRLDETIEDAVVTDRWPDVLLGLRPSKREMVALDVTGRTIGHVVFTAVDKSRAWSEHGLLTFEQREPETAAVLLHRYPDDPRTDTATSGVLVEPVQSRTSDEGVVSVRGLMIRPDELFVLSPEDALLRVRLDDGVVATEASGVDSFAVSPDGQWLLWQRLAAGADDNDPGPLFLRDLGSGAELGLGDGFMAPFAWYDDDRFVMSIGERGEVMRLFDLATLDFVDLPDNRALLHVFPDGRLGVGHYDWTDVDVFDPDDGSVTPLVRGQTIVWWGEDAVEVLALAACCREGALYSEDAPLYSVALSGEIEARLAGRVSRLAFRMGDGRRLTALDGGDDTIGQLVLVDPDSSSTARIDHGVFVYSWALLKAFADDVVVYSVDDGERTGVWLARLPGA